MALLVSGVIGRSGGGRGGGGLIFRKPADVFTGADLAACRLARNTAFGSTGRLSGILAQYQSNQSLSIVLNPTNSVENTFETYLTGNVGKDYAATQWIARTNSIQGNVGRTGSAAQVNATVVDPLIAAYVGGMSALVLAEGQIPAALARDTELRTLLGNATARVSGLMSPTDKTKVDAVEVLSTADQTGIEIAGLLDTVIGNDDWRSQLANTELQDAIDKAVGSDAWRTGNTTLRTAAQIIALIDGAIGTVWKTASGATVTAGITLEEATDAAGELLATYALFTYDASTDTLAFALPGEYITPAMLKADSAIEKAAMTTRIGAAALTGAVFSGAVRGPVPINGADLTPKSYIDQAADSLGKLIKLNAPLAGATFTGAVKGISPVANADFVTLQYFNANKGTGGGGGGTVTPTPVIIDNLYFGVSDDAIPEPDELSIAGVSNAGEIVAYAGAKHHLIARLATEADIVSVVYSDDPTGLNQISGFMKYANTVIPTGASAAYSVWVSEHALTQPATASITVR